MLYFIITTSLINENYDIRKKEYQHSINLINKTIGNNPNIKIIIVENTGIKYKTFLNNLNQEVYYTNNNFMEIENKGVKEIYDILSCIDKYNIKDEDFIIKMTGRYYIKEDSDFINEIINYKGYDCIIKYGSYYKSCNHRVQDCITGLIGIKSKYIKKINLSPGVEKKGYPMEHEWAKVTMDINLDNVKIMNNLGIFINPRFNKKKKFFEV